MLARSEVRWVEAQGDYARLHTAETSHLIRVPLSVLPNAENIRYLRTKQEKMGHLLEIADDGLGTS